MSKKIKTSVAVNIIFVLIFVTIAIIAIRDCFIYETGHAYQWDSPLYWTVGRGILNGIKPYSGLYENKPVGVFLICAVSFALTDDIIICNYFSFMCLLIIALTPILCMFTYCKRKKMFRSKPTTAIQLLSIALLTGLYLMKYSEKYSGSYQAECLGAAFICLYFWAILHLYSPKKQEFRRKSFFIWEILAGFFVMCAVMFKEPFILLIVSVSFFFVESISDFVMKTLIPCFIGGILTIILLLCCGVLKEYFTIYIKYMLGYHISVYGSPIQRMLNFQKMFTHVYNFSSLFFLLIILSSTIIVLHTIFNKQYSAPLRLWKLFSFVFALLCASFAVGLGGQYFYHHYVLAIPFYMGLTTYACLIVAEKSTAKNIFLMKINFPVITFVRKNFKIICYLFLLYFFFINTILNNYFESKDRMGFYERTAIEASYVDNLLDYYGEDTYQFISDIGVDYTLHSFVGLTKHSPKGPVFIQDNYNFENRNNWFCQNLIHQLSEVNIVIVNTFNMPVLNDEVQEILFDDFTTQPSTPYISDTPSSFDCKIYFRKSVYE